VFTFGAIHYGRPSSKPSHVATMCIPLPRVSHDTCVSERVNFRVTGQQICLRIVVFFCFSFSPLSSFAVRITSTTRAYPISNIPTTYVEPKQNTDHRISYYCAIKQVPLVGSCVCLAISNYPSSKYLTKGSIIGNGDY